MIPLRLSTNEMFRNALFLAFSALFLLFSTVSLNAQFEEESARAAYELRMKGEILYAAAMLEKLTSQGKTEQGLVQYEMARTRTHQQLGGANWAGPDMIIGQSQWALSENPGNLLFAYYDAECRFGKAYISLMEENENASKDISQATEKLEKVLEMGPDFHEVRVQLVEIYSQLPEELAGNMEKAESHAAFLENRDPYFGMLARDAMLPDSLSRVEFWKKKVKENPKDTRMAVKLGKAYLLEGNIDEARPLFESAMKEDQKHNILWLQIARYHMYQVMWGQGEAQNELPLAEEAINLYLESKPEPIAPMRAWALGKLSMFKSYSGQEEEAKRLMNEATALDPSFSKATGLPAFDLYVPPGELYDSGDYVSFLRPF